MITVFCGTNRPNSYTSKVAKYYCSRLKEKQFDYQYFSLEDMPTDLLINEMYESNQNEEMLRIQDKFLTKATKFVFVFPEYNGSFPGVLKAFIDASDLEICWHNKKACLIGVAAGRAGNLKGMDHFTSILNYIKINVLHMKIPISSVSDVFNLNGKLEDLEIIELIDEQIDLFNAF